MPGVKWVLNLSRNEFISSLLLAEYLPKQEGRSSSGPGQQALGASETQSGGHPRTAQQPDDTTTTSSAPTYTPEHPIGAKKSDSPFRFKQRLISIQLVYQHPFYMINSHCGFQQWYLKQVWQKIFKTTDFSVSVKYSKIIETMHISKFYIYRWHCTFSHHIQVS